MNSGRSYLITAVTKVVCSFTSNIQLEMIPKHENNINSVIRHISFKKLIKKNPDVFYSFAANQLRLETNIEKLFHTSMKGFAI